MYIQKTRGGLGWPCHGAVPESAARVCPGRLQLPQGDPLAPDSSSGFVPKLALPCLALPPSHLGTESGMLVEAPEKSPRKGPGSSFVLIMKAPGRVLSSPFRHHGRPPGTQTHGVSRVPTPLTHIPHAPHTHCVPPQSQASLGNAAHSMLSLTLPQTGWHLKALGSPAGKTV